MGRVEGLITVHNDLKKKMLRMAVLHVISAILQQTKNKNRQISVCSHDTIFFKVSKYAKGDSLY